MNGLYKFGKLDEKLTEWGFPVIRGNKIFPPLFKKPFKKAYNDGKIEFGVDGIYYIDDNDKAWKGYMYMPSYHVQQYGDFPRIHLTDCKTIEDFIAKGLLKGYYEFSSKEYNNVYDRDTGKTYTDKSLKVCSNCSKKICSSIRSTEEFYQSLGAEIQKDISGYSIFWQKISKEYRQSKSYTCESCGIKPVNNYDRRHWQTHHKNGDKTNNNPANLECLCVLCHSYKDIQHEENFGRTRMKQELDSFIKTYRKELEKLNNPYLRKYDNKF